VTAFVARCLAARTGRGGPARERTRQPELFGGLGRRGAHLWEGAQVGESAQCPQRDSNPRFRSEVPAA
jgi:hypothetical protein